MRGNCATCSKVITIDTRSIVTVHNCKACHFAKYKRRLKRNGYVFIRVETENGPKYRQEHRMVAEKMIGRKLHPKEVVHHLNHIKDDNRPENLVVCKNTVEHIAKYHPETLEKLIARARANGAALKLRGRKPKPKKGPRGGGYRRIDLVPECKELLGKVPDKQLAETYGYKLTLIQAKRLALGIHISRKKP